MYYVSAPGIEELAINVQIIIIIMANIFNPNACKNDHAYRCRSLSSKFT